MEIATRMSVTWHAGFALWHGLGMAHDLPPAVLYPVSVPRGVATVFVCVPMMSVLLLICWLQNSQISMTGFFGAAVCWILSTVCSVYAFQRFARGHLWWDGSAWWWRPQSQVTWHPVEYLEVLWDAQSLLCMRWRLVGRTVCCGWMSASSEAWRWGDCRRAVYSLAANASPEY